MKRILSILLILGIIAGFPVMSYAGQPSQYVINLGDARWHTKLNAGLDALWDTEAAFAAIINDWAIEDQIVTMIPAAAAPTYGDADTFTLTGDYTSRFAAGAIGP